MTYSYVKKEHTLKVTTSIFQQRAYLCREVLRENKANLEILIPKPSNHKSVRVIT